MPSGAEAKERQPASAAAALPLFLCVLITLRPHLAPPLLEPLVLDLLLLLLLNLLLNLVLVLHVRLLDVISAERQWRSRARGWRLSLRPCLPANGSRHHRLARHGWNHRE